jgi:hypothetical protein
MSLLDTCKQYFPRLKWQWEEEPSICIGHIPNNVINVKVSTTQEAATITLRVEDDNDRVIDFIHCNGKIEGIDTLFRNFREEWKRFNRQLREILMDD